MTKRERDQAAMTTLHAWMKAIGVEPDSKAGAKLERELDEIDEAQLKKRFGKREE